MILGSFVLFFCAFLLLPIPPAAFVVWLVSVVMFFAGMSSRSTRKAIKQQGRQGSKSTYSDSMRECPSCKEQMRRDASVCPHCRRESPAWTFHEGKWWTKGRDGQDWFWLDAKKGTWTRSEQDQ